MEIDPHIKLFQSTRLKENKKAVELIKAMLIKFKDQHFSFNNAFNKIIEHFDNFEKEHITSRSDLKFLLNVFEKGKSNYEKGMSLLVIPGLLKPKFDKIETLDISFDEYLTHLAKKVSFSKVNNKFRLNYNLFEAMFKIEKFDGYKNLPEFDVRMFDYETSYYNLEMEALNLAYPKENNTRKIDETITTKENPFTFRREYIEAMKSKMVYTNLEGDYFNDFTTNYNDYLDSFFYDPYHQNSNIKLDCETQLFAKLLSEMKIYIFKKVSYKEIERSKLFTTKLNRDYPIKCVS